MIQGQANKKILSLSGFLIVVIALLGWYFYDVQQDTIRSLTDEYQATRQALGEDLSQRQQEIERLNTRVQQLQQNLDQTRQEKKQIEQRLQAELQSLATVSSELETDLREQQKQKKTLDEKIDTVVSEKDQLLAELESEQEKGRQLQQEIARVAADVDQKETALSDREQAVSQLNSQLEQTRVQQDLLKSRIEQLNQQHQKDSQHFAELEKRLKQELNESRFEISQLKNQMTVIKLTSEVLFSSGSARIKPAGREVLSVIAETLNNYPDRAINIEGHTDSVPNGKNSRYTTNWELSTARALAAVDYLQKNDQVDPKRLKVVGYGEHHPVASNDTAAGRQQNRRIEIRLLPKSTDSGA